MPPTRIAFLYTNLYSPTATVLTASSSVIALDVYASRNPDRSYVWRSLTQTGIQTIDVDFGSIKAVSAAAVANVKLIGTGALQLYHRGDAAAPGASVLVATLPAQDRDTRTAFVFFAAQSHRHWRFQWTNPTAANDYAELGYAFLGVEIEPTFNIRVPAQITRPDPSVGSSSVDGQETYARRTKYFTGAWEFMLVPEAQLTAMRTLWNTLGVSTPMFMVLDTALAWSSWYARLAGELGIQLELSNGRYTVTFPWREVR